jgi:pyrroline-5-carboxylate reductase
MNATVFLGGGRITGALLAGLQLAEYGKPIIVHDRNPRKLRDLRKNYAVDVEKNLKQAVEKAKLLIIAVRPDSVGSLLREIGPVDRPLTAVSLAAGVPFAKLRAGLPTPVRWARAMPSPVCRNCRGLTALAFDRNFSAVGRREITGLFSRVGQMLEIPESKFDAFTVSYSSSHGYHALAVLAAAAQKLGLDRRTALTAAAHALADGIIAWREGGASLDGLLQEAVTPGGIAAAVIAGMDHAGFRRAIEKGLAAGLARTRKNAKLA